MAAAELLLVAVPLCLTGLGAVEAARWQLARLAVRHALYEAARAGAVHGADSAAVAEAFERALVPLEARPGATAGLPRWRMERLTPHAAHFDDFGVADAGGGRRMRFEYQAEQHADALARGWREGRGPRSGDDVYAANTLTLRVTYLHPPMVPGMQAALRTWPAGAGDGLAQAGRRQLGWLAIDATVALPMQSAAREGAARILPAPLPDAGATPGQAPVAPGAGPGCVGWWCAPASRPVAATPGTPGTPAAPSPPAPELWQDDPACGVVLCCTPG